jgi:CheY-like chemotaxis protein
MSEGVAERAVERECVEHDAVARSGMTIRSCSTSALRSGMVPPDESSLPSSGGAVSQERRQTVRSSPKGTVSIRATDYDVRGRIANVSRGGLCAITLVTPPERVIGCSVELEIRFDTQQSAWIRMSGHILRLGATRIAIGFDRVPDGFDRLIEDTLNASHSRNRVLATVLVDSNTERRQRMAEAFRAAGCAVVDVSTPLEAIVRLGEFHFEPDIIAIADSLPATIADELRKFVDLEHPRAKLVTINDDVTGPEGIAHWLSAADLGDDLARHVLDILLKPRRV